MTAIAYSYGLWRSPNQTLSWASVQPTKGFYTGTGSDQANMVLSWTNFDARINEAKAAGIQICLMPWLMPSWASIAGDQVDGINTTVGPWGGVGESCVPSNFQYVKDITAALLSRAIGLGWPIKYLEQLNEPEFYNSAEITAYIAASGRPFWKGTATQAVTFGEAVRSAAKAVDSTLQVLGPAEYDQGRLSLFLNALDPVSGKKGHQTFDIGNIHPYTVAPNKALNGVDLYYAGGSRIGVAAYALLLAAAGGAARKVAVTEWGINSGTGADVTAFNSQTPNQKKLYIQRLIAMAALDGLEFFAIFSFSTLAGDYDTDTTGVISAVTDVHTKLAGKTIISGGWYPDGSVLAKLSDGTVYVW